MICYLYSYITTILPWWRSGKASQFETEMQKLEAELSRIMFNSSLKAWENPSLGLETKLLLSFEKMVQVKLYWLICSTSSVLSSILTEILGIGKTSQWIYDVEASGVSFWKGSEDSAVLAHCPSLQWWW